MRGDDYIDLKKKIELTPSLDINNSVRKLAVYLEILMLWKIWSIFEDCR